MAAWSPAPWGVLHSFICRHTATEYCSGATSHVEWDRLLKVYRSGQLRGRCCGDREIQRWRGDRLIRVRLEKLRDEKPGTSCFSRLMSGLPSELTHLTWKGRSGSIQKVSCLVLGSAKVFASDYKDLFSPNSMSETRAPAQGREAGWPWRECCHLSRSK